MAGFGDSGVVVLVPAAEPVVSTWRRRHDPPAAQGMPAHITLLYPFLPEARLDAEVLDRLRALCAATGALDVELARIERFPETIYLAPEPATPFAALTGAIAAEWPERPPYGGAYDVVTPHLTIADGVDTPTMDAIDRDVRPKLPVRAHLTGAHLFVFDGQRWQAREALPFSPRTRRGRAARA